MNAGWLSVAARIGYAITMGAGGQTVNEAWPEAARAKAILENAPCYIFQLTPGGQYLFLNKFAPGFTRESLAGKSIFDFTDPKDHAALRECLDRVLHAKVPASYPTVGPGPNGAPTRYFTQFAPVLEHGEVSSIVAVASDVTPVVDMMAALEESEGKLRLALSASRMGLWSFSDDDTVSAGDARSLEIFGLPLGATSAEVFATLHPDDLQRVQDALAEALRTDGAYGPIEMRITRPDGERRWIQGFGSVVKVADGKRRIHGGAIDITERKELEERLIHSDKMESIGRLAGGIAHDFNNMLTAMLSYADFALRTLPPGGPREDIEEIRLAARRSAALAGQLLTFARRQHVDIRTVDPNTVVRQVDALLRRVLETNIELVTVLGATAAVQLDPGQFEQLLLNLAANARDAMKGGGKLTIETLDATIGRSEAERLELALSEGAADRTVVRIRVSDDGVGMSPRQLERVFEPFFTTKDVGKGTGLGLAMAYGIVKKHGGHIQVDSREGGGTTFVITLPAASSVALRHVAAPQDADGASGGTEGILVVEDEPQVRALVARTLRTAGYHVLEAANGPEAFLKLEAHASPIAVLVTDMVMPHMSGRQIAETLARSHPDMAVLFMSGYSEESMEMGAVTSARTEFLSKPFLPGTLLTKVRAVLDQKIARLPSAPRRP